jgi:hypothetical protein
MSRSNQNRCSGMACTSRSALRSTSGGSAPNKTSISGASSTTLSIGSAMPRPARKAMRSAVIHPAWSNRVLPKPGPPSITTTEPMPSRACSKRSSITANCASRPRIGSDGKAAIAASMIRVTTPRPGGDSRDDIRPRLAIADHDVGVAIGPLGGGRCLFANQIPPRRPATVPPRFGQVDRSTS